MELRQSKDVLVVDDDDEVRTMICAALGLAGLSCDAADQGYAALEQMRLIDYAVVLLDVVMPHLDGIQVLTELQSWNRAAYLKPVILLMTALPDREFPLLPNDVAQAILRKPLEIHELIALVAGCVRRQAAQRSHGLAGARTGVQPQ